jgi:hypothetical protein
VDPVCAIIHADTKDARGIDVAFIYDRTLFDAPQDGFLPRCDAPQRDSRPYFHQ